MKNATLSSLIANFELSSSNYLDFIGLPAAHPKRQDAAGEEAAKQAFYAADAALAAGGYSEEEINAEHAAQLTPTHYFRLQRAKKPLRLAGRFA